MQPPRHHPWDPAHTLARRDGQPATVDLRTGHRAKVLVLHSVETTQPRGIVRGPYMIDAEGVDGVLVLEQHHAICPRHRLGGKLDNGCINDYECAFSGRQIANGYMKN